MRRLSASECHLCYVCAQTFSIQMNGWRMSERRRGPWTHPDIWLIAAPTVHNLSHRRGGGGAHKLNKCDQSAPLLPALHWMSPLLGTAAASAKLQTVTFASAALEAMEEQQNNSAPWSVTMEMCPTSFAGLSGRFFFEAPLSRSLYSPITHNYTPSLGQIKKTQQLLVLFSWVN